MVGSGVSYPGIILPALHSVMLLYTESSKSSQNVPVTYGSLGAPTPSLVPGVLEGLGWLSSSTGFSLQQVMAQWWQILLELWMVMPTLSGDKPVNICMNAKHHKQEPGPEDKLYLEVQEQELAPG